MKSNWIILPDLIIEQLELMLGKALHANDVLNELQVFVEDELFEKDKKLHRHFIKKIDKISPNTIRKAVSRLKKEGIDGDKRRRLDAGISEEDGESPLFELICWFAFDKNQTDTLASLGIEDHQLERRASDSSLKEPKENNSEEKFENEDDSVNETDHEESNEYITSRKITEPNIPFLTNSKYFQYIHQEFWEKTKIAAQAEKPTTLSRYYTHSDSSLIVKAVAMDDFIIPPPESFTVLDDDQRQDMMSFSQILDNASSQSFGLIKILAEGGVGKSTFLYWIAKNYCSEYYIFFVKKVDEVVAMEITTCCEIMQKNSSRPFIIMVDNAAYSGDSALKDFIIELKERCSFLNQIIFILAERVSRFNIFFSNNEIENEFSGNIQTINYIIPDRSVLFEKIYMHLENQNHELADKKLKEKSQRLFLNNLITSASESLYLLLDYLKLENKIRYDFDWDDWYKFIEANTRFEKLRYLFAAVACFYQYGIRPKITLKTSFLKEANRQLILDALSSFGLESSPIVLDENNEFLELKHEYVASWFLKEKKNKVIVQGFFRDFLKEINDVDSAKLLRKMRKIFWSYEFKTSCLFGEINAEKYLEIVNNYLTLETISEDERIKMMNEKGLILMQLRAYDQAITFFKLIADNYPKNIPSRDQLAKYYSRSPRTYDLAINYYHQIFLNDGIYAFIQITNLLEKAQKKNISLTYKSELEFSTSIQENLIAQFASYPLVLKNSVINEFIKNNQLAFAEDLINKIKNPDRNTAECCNRLAKTYRFSDETIIKKNDYFLRAIEISRLTRADKNYVYIMEYAVFLFRIREFSKSHKYIRKWILKDTNDVRSLLFAKYSETIRATIKLFFKNIPDKNDMAAYHSFFSTQCYNAAALINHKENNVYNILKGYLILQTVKFHCKYIVDEFYYSSIVQLAYCHAVHAEKNWNNFSARENRIIAENYFDQVLNEGGTLSPGDCSDMIKNLLNIKESGKYVKALKLIENILQNQENANVPTFYRYRGNCNRFFRRFSEAMHDYRIALQRSLKFKYTKAKYFKNDMAYTYNNMALLICDAIEEKMTIYDFTIEKAIEYCNQIENYRRDFEPLIITRKRIEDLKNKN